MKKTIKKIRKHSMTLLEIMVVISMLAMLGGLLAFKAKDLFDTYGFRQEVSILAGKLELAQHYARSYQADVEVIFHVTQGQISCELRSDEPYLRAHKVFYSPYLFKKIKAITFSGREELASGLLFSGTGWMFPTKNLDVHPKSKDQPKVLIPIAQNFQ